MFRQPAEPLFMLFTTLHPRLALIAIVATAITFVRTRGEAQTGGSRQFDQREAAHNHHWREAQSCGVACGYMLARLLGREVTYDDAVAAIPVEQGGSSLLALQKGLATLGVSATVLQAKPRDLEHLATPLIAHVLPRRETSNAVGHFLLVLQIDDRAVRYIEPNYAASIETVPRSQFVRCWTGYVILPESRIMAAQRRLEFALWGVIAASVSIGSFPLIRWGLRHRPAFWWRRAGSLACLLVSCVMLGCSTQLANVGLPVEQSASPADGIVAKTPSSDALRLVAWNTEADIGVLPRDGAAEGIFRIENQGNFSVRLHLGSPTCRCSEARLEQETLVAGASTSVHMMMRSRSRQAGPADARVYIEAEGGCWAEALSVHAIELGANFPNYTYMVGGSTKVARTASIVGTLFLEASSSEPKVDVPLAGTGLESVLVVQDIRVGPPVETSGYVRRECSFSLGINQQKNVAKKRQEVVLPVRVTIDGEVSTYPLRVSILPADPAPGGYRA
jgi:predicted double-glycine peptidase